MALLTFQASEVRRLIDHARAAEGTLMDAPPCLFLDGTPPDVLEGDEWGWLSSHEWGVYLMSNGVPGPKGDEPGTEFVARPRETATPDAAERERERLFDPYVCQVPLDLNELERAMEATPDATELRLIVSPWAVRPLPTEPSDEELRWAKSQPEDEEWQDRFRPRGTPSWETYLARLPAWSPMPEPPFKRMVHRSEGGSTH